MKSVLQKGALALPQIEISRIRAWLFSWELYPIIFIASFLRFYRINTTPFDLDQANVYRMAYDAVHRGILPLTANFSSLGGLNPPAVIYIYIPPAAFSANPLWGAVMTALLGTIAILLTYLFVRHYYGRLAGIFAALFYATLNLSVYYSRIIWNQNLLLFFTPLFIITLFIGVVSRRKGWFFPAVFLLGLMIQLHASSSLLVVVLLVAVILAPGTIRWRDLGLATFAILILYAPYLVWEIHNKFNDIFITLQASKQPAFIDNQAVSGYQTYVEGYVPTNPQSPLYPFVLLLQWINDIMAPLLVLAGIMVLGQVLYPHKNSQTQKQTQPGLWEHILRWWSDFRADPYRCGLLVLLIWQVIPLILLSRHSIPVYSSYLIFFMPGQYILIALLLTNVARWLRQFNRWRQVGYYALFLFALLIIAVQAISSLGYIVDGARGNLDDAHFGRDYHYKLNALQNALNEADQLAQQRGLHHVYISIYADYYHMSNVSYLAEHMHTPTSVFSDNCLMLPASTTGPAVLLEGPYNTLTDTLLSHFASATLIDKPRDIGSSDSFKLFIVEAYAVKATVQATFPREIQPLDSQLFNFQHAAWVVTRWSVLHSAPTSYRTAYAYNIMGNDLQASDPQSPACLSTSMQQGDQLLRAFPLPRDHPNLTSLDMRVESYTIRPLTWEPQALKSPGISFETGAFDTSPGTILHTSDGQDHIILPVPKQGTGGSN